LDERSPYAHKRFEDLDEANQRKLKQSVLRAVNIRQLNPAGEGTSAYHIFERLNTGGTPLKPQEIRNCVFKGALSQMLKDANRDKNWRRILGKKTFDKHQKDVELVLRLFALVGTVDTYEKPMKEYLNRAMKKHGDGTSRKVERFFAQFPKATALIASKLGERPFHLRGPLNTSALDSVMVVLIENFGEVKADKLADRYATLLKHKNFGGLTVTATTDTNTLRSRVELARQILVG
jgi:hypothetical protein